MKIEWLQDSETAIEPVDVKVFEHDGYVDYEIEFVELGGDHINLFENTDLGTNKFYMHFKFYH